MLVDRIQSIPRLSPLEMVVLELLIQNRQMYGLELVAKSYRRLKKGTVYVTLARMEEKGYIESTVENRQPGAIGLPRRLYHATGHGQRVFEAMEIFAARVLPGESFA